MKFSINQSEFQTALNVVSKGTSSHPALPILSGVLLRAEDSLLILETTNMDMSIRCKANVLVEEEGRAVIPAHLLSDIVKNLPDAAVHFESDEESATVLCDSSSFSLKALPGEDFPGFPEVLPDQKITLPFNVFNKMVKRVAKVASKDKSHAILTGVLVEVEDNHLRMVATDSFRLAVSEADIEGASSSFSAVIDGSFLLDIASLPVLEEGVEIALSENQIVVNYNQTTFINRRIEGTYPNWQQLLPESYLTKVVFEKELLNAAVKRNSLLSNRVAPIKIDIDTNSQTVQLSTVSQDIGRAQETLTATIEGESGEIAFNFAYVLDGLASIETDSVTFEYQGSMKPGIFKADAEENLLYLIMPVRISQ